VALTNSGANDVALTNGTATVLAASTVGRNLSVISNGAITETGVLTVAGTSSFAAGANAITLTQSNQLGGAVTLSNSGANDVALTNNQATVLAASTVGRNLTVLSNGALTETGVLTVAGTSSFSAGANAITLTQNNQLGGAVALSNSGANDAQLTNSIATDLGISSVGRNLTVASAGAITNSGALTVASASSFSTTAGNASVTIDNAANALAGVVTLAPSGSGNATLVNTVATTLGLAGYGGNLSVTTGGGLSQNGALTVAGTSSFNVGANGLSLTNAGNALTGAVSLANSGANDAALTNSLATDLGGATVGRNLTVTSGGAITNSGGLTVAGTSSFTTTALNASVTVDNAANALGGAVTLVSNGTGNATLVNTLATAFAAGTIGGNLSVTAGAVTQTGALVVTGSSRFNAGANAITLTDAGNSFAGGISLTNSGANAVTLVNGGAVSLGSSTIGGPLRVTAAGAVTQTGALTVAGTSVFDAGANAIDLTNAGNRFTAAINLTNSGANDVRLTNAAATSLGSASVGRNLDIASGGALTQTGALTVAGTSSFGAGANAIILTSTANHLTGAVTLSNSGGASASLTNAAPLILGASTVGGDLSLLADGLAGSGIVRLGGNLTVAPLGLATNLRLGGAGSFAGLDLNDAQLARFTGYTAMTFGAANGTGRLSVAASETFASGVSVVLRAGGAGGSVRVDNALTLAGAGALTLTGGGVVAINAAIQTATGSVTVNGPAELDPPITTSGGAITFNGALTVTVPAVLSTTGNGSAGASISIAGPISGAGQSLGFAAGIGDIRFGAAVGADGALGSITIESARDVTASGPVFATRFTQLQGSGTTDFQGSGLTVGAGSFTGNRFMGTYTADSLEINSNTTTAAGTVGGIGGAGAARLIRSRGSSLTQTFNGVPFPFVRADSRADSSALIIQIDHNAVPEMLRAGRAATSGARPWTNTEQLLVESELAIGDIDSYVMGLFEAASDGTRGAADRR
jgi:hypothetical protein